MRTNLLHRSATTAFAIAALSTSTHADLVDPVLVGQSTFTGNPLHVLAQGNTVAVSSSNSSVHLFDVTDPSSPQPITSIPTSGPAYESFIAGSTLFVACGTGGCGCDTPSCPGDVTGDGETDLADLNTVLAAFGTGCD